MKFHVIDSFHVQAGGIDRKGDLGATVDFSTDDPLAQSLLDQGCITTDDKGVMAASVARREAVQAAGRAKRAGIRAAVRQAAADREDSDAAPKKAPK